MWIWNHINGIFANCSTKFHQSICILNGSLTLYASVTSLVIWKILAHRVKQIFHYKTSTYTQKNHMLISWPISSEKSVSTDKLSSSSWWIQISQNSSFCLKAQLSSLPIKHVNCFFEASFFHFKRENTCQIPISITRVCLSTLFFK